MNISEATHLVKLARETNIEKNIFRGQEKILDMSKKWEETVEVPCPGAGSTFDNNEFDNNDCSEGKIAGGILGAGFATAISRGKDRWWAIPAGLVGGSMVGCQIDGG
jgi:hypothetical protein